ncbi:hypothetical protein L8106_06829 [Lyngbya sp. PCC 8106]|nr:hypothetical protein L8106_06829 [Lyngbya sp. PCC 8106]
MQKAQQDYNIPPIGKIGVQFRADLLGIFCRSTS